MHRSDPPSVGLVLTARPLISDLKRRYPNLRMLVHHHARRPHRRGVPNRTWTRCLFPFDRHFRGKILTRCGRGLHHDGTGSGRTQAWEGRARGIKPAVVNGRLGDRLRIAARAFMRVGIYHFGAERRVGAPIHRPGADPARVVVRGPLGSARTDVHRLQARPAIACCATSACPRPDRDRCGSTMKGEESAVLRVRRVRANAPSTQLVIAPQLERFGRLERWCDRDGKTIDSESRRRGRARHHRRAGHRVSDRQHCV